MQSYVFHHTGVITPDLSTSVATFTSFGYQPSRTYVDELQKVQIVLMRREHTPIIELIQPTGPDSPAFHWLKRIQAGAYHICFSVSALDNSINDLKSKGFVLASPPKPAIAFDMHPVAFLWSKGSGLLELVENPPV